MKRTAADFAREALDDGPFELDINTGKSVKTVRPLPLSDMTFDQNREIARLSDVWAIAYNEMLEQGRTALPETPSGVKEMEPTEFRMRFRFGALCAQDPTDDDPRLFTAEQSTTARAADYELFRKHVWQALPWPQVARLLNAVDEYYDPTPATDAEQDDAAADPDGDAAGKSGTGAG